MVFAAFWVPPRPAPTVHVSMPIAAIVNHGFLVHKLCSLLEKRVAKDERVQSSASSIDVTGQGARAEGGERGKGRGGLLDNYQYRDWRSSMADQQVKDWLLKCQELHRREQRRRREAGPRQRPRQRLRVGGGGCRGVPSRAPPGRLTTGHTSRCRDSSLWCMP